ncbi:ADP-ribosylation factor-like protein 13B [Chionoecetes opilio]|uniref:ADP-ribosylation factor-like protein 13B n=1 Tax=Chionoecetes opilio TaxID=41210 RepID=A0A8J4YEB5_CHIOP|nr:ADP-ribosylation factor-like protein 13B [Chionoecetes opilio]
MYQSDGKLRIGRNSMYQSDGKLKIGRNSMYQSDGKLKIGRNSMYQSDGKLKIGRNSMYQSDGKLKIGRNSMYQSDGKLKIGRNSMYQSDGGLCWWVHGVIFVVDSTAGARLAECEEVLISLLADPKIAGKPVLILANKQDVEGAMDEIDLVEGLKVEEIVNRFKCPTRVETCSALATRNRKPDKPIADGFRWLVDTIVVHYKEINARVTKDLERERLKQRRELEERKERLKQLRAEREELAAASGAQRSEAPPRQAASSATKRNSTSSSSSSPPSPISSFPSSPRASSGVTKAEVVVRRDMEDREEEVVVKTSPLSPAASMVPNTLRTVCKTRPSETKTRPFETKTKTRPSETKTKARPSETKTNTLRNRPRPRTGI